MSVAVVRPLLAVLAALMLLAGAAAPALAVSAADLPADLPEARVLDTAEVLSRSARAELDRQLADLGMQLLALLLVLRFGLGRLAGPEDPGGVLQHLLLPVRDLHRVDLELLGDLLDRLDSLDGFQGHAGLELGFVSFSFCFLSVLQFHIKSPRRSTGNM